VVRRNVDSAELREFAGEWLPPYMVPSAFVILDRIPLTTNGKVDLSALPEPDEHRAAGSNVASPAGDVEGAIASIWSEVLSIDVIGRHDDFFDLGGHSLLATQVILRVRKMFSKEIELRLLFERPRLADFAEVVEGYTSRDDTQPELVPISREEPLPLSHAQARLWFLDQLSPGDSSYNISASYEIDGSIDVSALARAIDDLVERHESLRTVFTEENGVPGQRVLTALSAVLRLYDLSELTQATRDAELSRLSAHEAESPFSLPDGPLFRAALFRVAHERHVLQLTMHHIVSDGWSLEVIEHDLSRLYEAHHNNIPHDLQPLPVQYADYATWHRAYLTKKTIERQLSHWQTVLNGAPRILQLPGDHARPSTNTRRGDSLTFSIPTDITERVRQVASEEDATPFMVLLAAFQIALANFCQQDDLLIGVPVAGRNRADLERLVGFFVNTLVFRAQLGNGETFRDAIRNVREQSLDAHANQDLPFDTLIEALRPDRDLSRNPVVQAAFQVFPQAQAGVAIGQCKIDRLPDLVKSVRWDIEVDLTDAGTTFDGTLYYYTEVMSANLAKQLIEIFQRVLECQRVREEPHA
jgi:hypothetical protein